MTRPVPLIPGSIPANVIAAALFFTANGLPLAARFVIGAKLSSSFEKRALCSKPAHFRFQIS
jgi:hypothetical protein